MKKQFAGAFEFVKQYKLTQHRLTSDILKQIFMDLGYEILIFNKVRNTQRIQKIIDAYDLHDHIEHHKIFIFVSDNVKLLFVHDYMTEKDKVHYLLHELGHIQLDHTSIVGDEATQDREADEFAAYVKFILNHQRGFIFIAAILIITILISYAYNFIDIPAADTPTHQNNIEMVYKTTGGEKIHRADCIYIQNKSNVIEIPKDEAIAAGYEPCKVCNP